MNCDGVMILCCAAARKRHPTCDAGGEIVRASDYEGGDRPYLSGEDVRGWIAWVSVTSGTGRSVARHEAHGMTKGWASGALARAMGVEIPDGP